jgi:AcrR family transcriptional regulator
VAKKRQPKTRAERKAGTRDRIRRAAFELFTTEGFDATTTKAIARRARVASGTVFVHAADKSDLLYLVMHDLLDETLSNALATLPRGKLVDRAMHVFGALYALYDAHPALGREFVRRFGGAGSTTPNAQRMTTLTLGFLQRIVGLVVEAQRRGEVRKDVQPMTAATNMFAAYFLVLVAWLDGRAHLVGNLDTTLRESLALQVRGLESRPSRPRAS